MLNGQPPPSRDDLKDQLRTQRLQLKLAQAKARTRLLESFSTLDWGLGGSDLFDRLRPRDNDGDGRGRWLPISVPSDRRHGANWPVWRTQPELDSLRQESRVRFASNSFAQGLVLNLTNSVVGKGYDYKAACLGPDGKPAAEEQLTDQGRELVRAVQRVIDGFLRLNHWNCSVDPRDTTALGGTRERQVYQAVRVDGECFLRFHRKDDGTTLVRQIDASQIRNGPYLPEEGWFMGRRHQMEPYEDVETILEYASYWPDLVAKGGEGGRENDESAYQLLPADEVLHLKGPDTPANVARGLPLLTFDVGRALDRASNLQRCASVGAAVRAATAELWQVNGATQQQIQSMAQAVAEGESTDPVTGNSVPIEKWWPGMVRRIPEGLEAVERGADSTESYMAGKDGDLQAACAGAGVASFVLGGLESGNYSNFESAAYPPVVNAQCEQEYFKAAFTRAVWKAVEWAAECRRLPADVCDRVTILVEAPAVLHRNELEKAQQDQIGVQEGWKDRQTCAAERGLDWRQVKANNEQYQQRQQELMPQPQPGQPGEGGKPGAPGQPRPAPKPPGPKPPRPTAESIDREHGKGAALAVARAAVRLLEGHAGADAR